MRYFLNVGVLCSCVVLLAGCASAAHVEAPVMAAPNLAQPLYRMTPNEVHTYIGFMQKTEPDLRKRIAAIGRKNIGQPYVLNLMGEYPFQLHDSLPMFSLTHSDCVVFAEHTYAMALSSSWEEFFWMLQRIRYKDGVIGVASRNHYTEVDWNVNNSWLVTDISAELSGPTGPSYPLTVDRAGFLKKRHHTDAQFEVQETTQRFVDKAQVAQAIAGLEDGDLVNVISSKDGKYWASHVGLVVLGAGGQRMFLHSSDPQVREESFDAFIARAAERESRLLSEGKNPQRLAGFKFLRLNQDIVVPPAAPQPRPTAG